MFWNLGFSLRFVLETKCLIWPDVFLHPEESPPAAHYTQCRFKAPPTGEAAFNVYIQDMFKYTLSPIFNTSLRYWLTGSNIFLFPKRKEKNVLKRATYWTLKLETKYRSYCVSIDEFAIRSISGSICSR